MLLAGVILDIRRENKHENEIDLRNEWLDIKAGLLTHPPCPLSHLARSSQRRGGGLTENLSPCRERLAAGGGHCRRLSDAIPVRRTASRRLPRQVLQCLTREGVIFRITFTASSTPAYY